MRGRLRLAVLLIGLVFLGAGSVAQETSVKISITAPVDRSVTTETKVQVEGIASTTAPGDSVFIVLVVVNGVAQKADLSSDGKFKSIVNLVPGENLISAIAVTKNREVASAKVSVTMNPTPQVIFFDDFEKTPRPEWKPEGPWGVINGWYSIVHDQGGRFYSLVDLKTSTTTRVVDVDAYISCGGYAYAYIFIKAENSQNAVTLRLDYNNTAQWTIRQGGEDKQVTSTPMKLPKGQPVHVRIEVKNMGEWDLYRGSVNDTKLPEISLQRVFPQATKVGVGFNCWGGRVFFDNFKVESTGSISEQPSSPVTTQTNLSEQPATPQPPATDLEPRVAQLESQVSGLQGTVAALSVRVDKIESQLVSPGVPAEFGQRLSTLERLVGNVDVEGLSKELATVKITVASLTTDQTRFKQDLSQLKQALPSSGIEDQLAQIQQSLDSLSQKVEDSNKKLATAEGSARLALTAGTAGVVLALLVVLGVID